MMAKAKDLVNAGDKYGIVNLKLEAEAAFVTSTTFTADNVMEHLLYAHDKGLALLKEAALDFILKIKDQAKGKQLVTNLPGHFVNDLLDAKGMDGSKRVNTLRKKLHEKGLDIGGSKQELIARLEGNT